METGTEVEKDNHCGCGILYNSLDDLFDYRDSKDRSADMGSL